MSRLRRIGIAKPAASAALCITLCMVLMGVRRAAAQVDQSGTQWSSQHIDLDVYPDFRSKRLHVSGSVLLKLEHGVSAGPTLTLGHDVTPYSNTRTEFMRYTSVSASGAKVELNRSGGRPGIVLADVRFARAKRRGDLVNVHFDAELVAPSFTFAMTDQVAMGAGETGWYPRPMLSMEIPPTEGIDPTPGVTRIHFPDGWSSVATGTFVSRTREMTGWVESWRQDAYKARSFAVGTFTVAEERIGDLVVRVYSLTPAMNPDSLVRTLASILGALKAHFGPYPYSKYAAAEFPDSAVNWWGIALGDFQILRTSLVTASNGGFVPLAHEIGHAWWGNKVEPTWPGGYMISEAMAGYSSLLALEGVFGEARYRRALVVNEPGTPPDYTMTNHFKLIAEGKDIPLSQQVESGTNYQLASVKGTFFYHMLRQRVGDRVFFATLQKLLRDHANGTLSLAQLRAAFLAAAPDKGLMAFFEQWLDRAGAPVITSNLTCTPAAGGHVVNHVVLEQTQAGAPYQFTMGLRLIGSPDRAVGIDIRDRTTALDVDAPGCASAVELDPKHDLFIWRPEYGKMPH